MISGNLNLHPLIILISLYIGLELLGIVGIFLGPLIVAVLRDIYKDNTS